MSHTPGGGHPQGWDNKLADRSSLPPVPGEERGRPLSLYPEVSNPNFHRYHGNKISSTGKKSGGSGPTGCGDVSSGSRSPPAYLRWARNLRDLLEDAKGVELFQQFVCEAGQPHADRLKFYFACQGLKRQKDPSKVKSLVAVIYRFLKKSQLTIPEDVRRRIKLGLKDDEPLDVDIFDSMQTEVEKLIKETTYVSFLRSDTYLKYAQESQHSNLSSTQSSGSISSSSSSKELYGSLIPNTLATLHEGEELNIPKQHLSLPSTSQQISRLTKDSLMATQKKRLQPETFTGDGMSMCRTNHGARREHSRHLRGITESANMNKDIRTRDMMIPRTLRLQKGQCTTMKPDVFAHLLTEKLERVKRDRDNQEKFDRKLMEAEDDGPSQAIPARMVAAALREKLQLDDDNDQAILDQHVSRVWSDPSPARSPGRPTSPPHPHGHGRRCRDLHSTLSAQSALSADSGNVRDFSDTLSSERTSNMSVSKSRSLSRKTLTDLTDSGVSVVSDTPPIHSSGMPPSHQPHSRILMWIQDGANNIDRYGRKSFSRSGSAERPGQPIATDPQMPLLPSPHTPTQLDEARRRLMLEHQAMPSSIPPALAPRHPKRSGQTCGKTPPAVPSDAPSTVVMITFLDEHVPYRTKIPAAPVTLKQFKEYLPKKGNYRYFFKTECEELENTPIQEEIFNDSDILPLWEGKIMAKVKNVE